MFILKPSGVKHRGGLQHNYLNQSLMQKAEASDGSSPVYSLSKKAQICIHPSPVHHIGKLEVKAHDRRVAVEVKTFSVYFCMLVFENPDIYTQN